MEKEKKLMERRKTDEEACTKNFLYIIVVHKWRSTPQVNHYREEWGKIEDHK